MTQRITRRDMKRNELAETVGKTVDYVSGHKKGVTEAVAIAAGLAILVGGLLRVPRLGQPRRPAGISRRPWRSSRRRS